MKRDKRLHSLSWDHQHGLAFAQEIKKALANRDHTSIEQSVEALEKFWNGELQQHLQAEEEILLPVVRTKGEAFRSEIEVVLNEHRELSRLFLDVTHGINAEGIRQGLRQFAELLIRHIRFEEGILFPRVEKALGDSELDRVGEKLGRGKAGAAGGTGMGEGPRFDRRP